MKPTTTKKGVKMTEIVKFIRDELERQLKDGQPVDAAVRAMELSVRTTFAGERVYIASHPKQRRAVQIAKLNLRTTREIATATGMSPRTVRYITRGK